jgi:hypothetical protein
MSAGRLAVSSAQEALWLAQRLNPDLPNNISGYLEIYGPIDHLVIAAAWRRFCREAETLRVSFSEDQDGLHQVLRDAESWEPDFFDVCETANPESAAHRLISDITDRAFNLNHSILYRAGLIKLNERRYFLFMVVHHTVCDGFGILVVGRRISQIYTALKSGVKIPRCNFCSLDSFARYEPNYKCTDRFI